MTSSSLTTVPSGRQLALPFLPAPSHHAADWVADPSNEAAEAWLARWPDWPSGRLALFGAAGVGKTHRAAIWRAASAASSLDPADIPVAEAGFGPAQHLLLDDADLALRAPALLLHLLNATAERGGTILLVSRTAPARWTVGLPDLASRLAALPAVAITAPEDALLRALLLKHAADRQLAIPPSVIDYLLARMERSAEAARTLVARMDRLGLAQARAMTRAIAAAALADDTREGAAGEADRGDGGEGSAQQAEV